MRIKVLACAAVVAASALTSMAQSNVYSLNVVGYINIPLVEGFNMIANQLDLDGTGNNNFVSSVFSNNLPVNTRVYLWDPIATTYNFETYSKSKTGVTSWGGASGDISWNPGQGAWVSIPAGAFGGTGITQNVTTVGTVLQGSLSNTNIPPLGGFSIVASQIPLAGGVQTTLGYQPQVNERVYMWDPIALSYTFSTYSKTKTGTLQWVNSLTSGPGAEPQISVGEGFWINFQPNSSWKTNFTVGP